MYCSPDELAMPELPDVETFKRYLDATALHREIVRVGVGREDILHGVSRQQLSRGLKGRQFEGSQRHGKYLAAQLDRGGSLVLHFGMTGFLKYYKQGGRDPPHARLWLDFANGYRLAYDCQRLLGMVTLTDDFDRFVERHRLGPDALALDRSDLEQRLHGRRGALKSALMNQSIFAGLGNVYSDEILFQARLHPKMSVAELSLVDRDQLFRNLRKVLDKAIEGKADPGRVPDSWLLPHRAAGAPCPAGNGHIQRTRVSGRTTYYCPECQQR
jgi:formamidopyrimidine-DNA glycosylase